MVVIATGDDLLEFADTLKDTPLDVDDAETACTDGSLKADATFEDDSGDQHPIIVVTIDDDTLGAFALDDCDVVLEADRPDPDGAHPAGPAPVVSSAMPGNPFTDPNWAADLADTVERVVASVRDKTTKPIVTVTRGLVYGLLTAILGIAAIVLLIIMAHPRHAGAPRPVQGAPLRRGVHQLSRGRWNLQPRSACCVLRKRYSND